MQQARNATIPPPRPQCRAAIFEDIRIAVKAGIGDFMSRPALSLLLGFLFALFGAILIAGLTVFDQIWIAIAAGVGFPFVAPFLAAGFYEMSRRIQEGQAFGVMDIILVILRQQRREFGWMSFVILFVFWIWAYQIRLLLAIILFNTFYGSLSELAVVIVTTQEGVVFLAIGSIIGAALSTALFSITVIAMPLLLEREVDFITAMITSVQAVLKSPVVMLGWGATIGALTLLAVAPALLGVIVIFPILGHATWHFYGRLMEPAG